MKNILTLLRVQFKNAYKLKDEKKGTIAITVVAFAILAVCFGFMGIGSTVMMGSAFLAKDLAREFLTIFFSASQIIVLVFGTIMMVGTLFHNRDNEFLTSLPMSPQEIFFSKFIYVYLNELVVSTAFVLMIGVTFGVIAQLSVAYYFSLILAAILLPLLPLLLSALLSIPIMFLMSYFRNRGILNAIVLLVLFGVVFFFYYRFIMSVQMMPEGDASFSIPDWAVEPIRTAAQILYPIYALTSVMLGVGNVWLNLVIVLGCFVALFGIGFLLSITAYSRGVRSQFEDSRRKGGKKTLDFRQNSSVKSLAITDFKEVMRNSTLAFYGLFQIILGPLMMIFIGSGTEGLAGTGLASFMELTMFLLFTLVIMMPINYVALTSFSREGQNFYSLRALPIGAKDVLRAKTLLAKIFEFAGLAVSIIVSFFVFKEIDVVTRIGFILFTVVFGDGFVHFLVSLDFKRPKLVWENIVHALKNNVNTFFALGVMLAVFAVVVGLTALAQFLLIGYLGLPALAVSGVLWCLLIAVAFGCNVLFRKMLHSNAEKRYAEIE